MTYCRAILEAWEVGAVASEPALVKTLPCQGTPAPQRWGVTGLPAVISVTWDTAAPEMDSDSLTSTDHPSGPFGCENSLGHNARGRGAGRGLPAPPIPYFSLSFL